MDCPVVSWMTALPLDEGQTMGDSGSQLFVTALAEESGGITCGPGEFNLGNQQMGDGPDDGLSSMWEHSMGALGKCMRHPLKCGNVLTRMCCWLGRCRGLLCLVQRWNGGVGKDF
jgi:hypothetical protein